MNYVSLDDMTAGLFTLGVARLDAHWQLAVGLMAGAVVIRFLKGLANKFAVPVSAVQPNS